MIDIRNICLESINELDEFVGLKFENGIPKVIFPKGYSISEDEEQIRKDIISLLSTIKKFSSKERGNISNFIDGEVEVGFPIISYQFLINDYLTNGYYVEREIHYTNGTRGSINWKRTIQMKKPVVSNGNVVYLDFIVKNNKINENSILTKIHEYCVKESFKNLGWLYLKDELTIPQSDIVFNKTIFRSVIYDELSNTFNEYKRKLLHSMLNIIECSEEGMDESCHASFGVKKYEVVWEKMVDCLFGVSNDIKKVCFPRGTWNINDNENGTWDLIDIVSNDSEEIDDRSTLKPDTIMIHDDEVFILDAKYYKYGVTKKTSDLPHTADIAKQIVYGEYVEKNPIYSDKKIYNAFVMPFDKGEESCPYKFVSVGTAKWKNYGPGTPDYYYILGILMDTRYLIENYNKNHQNEIDKLSALIVDSLDQYKKRTSP